MGALKGQEGLGPASTRSPSYSSFLGMLHCLLGTIQSGVEEEAAPSGSWSRLWDVEGLKFRDSAKRSTLCSPFLPLPSSGGGCPQLRDVRL